MPSDILIYSFFSFFILFVFARISYKFQLVDQPNSRKIHSEPISYTGGMGISIALIFSLSIFENPIESLNIVLSMAFLICIVGLLDDKYNLNVGSKLSLQIIPIFYLIIFQNLMLHHLGDYYLFRVNLGTMAMPFTLLCVLFLINAMNYFDGMDGTLSFSSISILAILFFLVPKTDFQIYLILLLIPVFIFIFFNFSILNLPKMFLGDCGSLLLGFIISFNLIYLANQNLTHPILLAWSVSIFVYEFISINLIRLKNKKNPFKAGQDHLHHHLFRKTNSLFLTNSLICFLNILFFSLGYLCFYILSPLASLCLFIILFMIFLILRERLVR